MLLFFVLVVAYSCMIESVRLIEFMRNMSKKGFYDIFEYVLDHNGLHYNEIQRYAWENRIVHSRASITTMLNWMVSFGLLEKHIVPDLRPIRTIYTVSQKGQDVLNKIKSLDL